MTVNKKKRGRPQGHASQMSQSAILETAKCLMKKEGKVPSIRALAIALDVDPMAIYHYFKNKNALLEALTTSLVAEIYNPVGDTDWQQEIKSLCVSYIELLREYSGLLQTMLSMTSHGPAQVFSERYQMIVRPLGLSEQMQKNGLDLLADYLHGFAFAISCHNDQCEITTEMMNGPVALICKALMAESDSN
ncbi:TetR/AcrR family transcriptional regulator [Vibrio astriarenae]|uniref:TetR/AcrR family transcriptional regulator n=1 Tax=Vibrio astriarenae TaxID=1481923 RepID=UPI003735C9A3